MFPVWNALQVQLCYSSQVWSSQMFYPDLAEIAQTGHTHQSRTHKETLPAILRTTLSALSSWSTDNGWFLCQSSRETRSYSIVELLENHHCFQTTWNLHWKSHLHTSLCRQHCIRGFLFLGWFCSPQILECLGHIRMALLLLFLIICNISHGGVDGYWWE